MPIPSIVKAYDRIYKEHLPHHPQIKNIDYKIKKKKCVRFNLSPIIINFDLLI